MNSVINIEPKSLLSRFTRRAGDEPIEGYRLLTPIGIGGFGEVWKCLAPGNVLKAMKIVTLPVLLEGTQTPAKHEQEAMDRVKEIRHPFMISVDRVDRVEEELFVVMELAESSLLDECEQCRSAGLPGIPDDELLHHLLEAAEILDVMNLRHGLQHLDVKPANLLLGNGHVKLADFGLVRSFSTQHTDASSSMSCCFTPRYASPELLQGAITCFSDQYSLAVVYQELLTGDLPFEGSGLLKRLLVAPDLHGLPETDRPVVARALAPNPEDRYPSCLEFVYALLACRGDAQATGYSRVMRCNSLSARRPNPDKMSDRFSLFYPNADNERQLETPRNPMQLLADFAAASFAQDPGDTPSPYTKPLDEQTEKRDCQQAASPNEWTNSETVQRLSDSTIYPPTIHVSDLKWRADRTGEVAPPLDDFIAQLAATETGQTDLLKAVEALPYRELPGEIIEQSFIMPAISSLSLRQRFEKILSECRAEMIDRSDKFVVFAVEAAAPFWKLYSSKQRILKVSVTIEAPNQGEVEWLRVVARLEPLIVNGPSLDPTLLTLRPLVLRSIRSVLQVGPERRLHRRFPCNFGLKLYPVLSDWRFDQVIEGKATDLSAGGIGLVLPREPLVNRFYLRPNAPNPLSDYAILAQTARKKQLPDGSYAVGAVFGRL